MKKEVITKHILNIEQKQKLIHHIKDFKAQKINKNQCQESPLKQIQKLQGVIYERPGIHAVVLIKEYFNNLNKTCHIIAVFDKNNYLPGEKANLWIDIDNSNCQLSIISIEAVLKNQLRLSNGNREKVINKVVNRSQIEGLPAGQKALGNDRKQMQIKLVDLNLKGEAIKPSSNGKLVKSVYELSAKANLDSCSCCSTDPQVRVPITVVAPVLLDQNALPPEPPNWNPQVFDSQLIMLNKKDIYIKSKNQGLNQQMAQPYM
ncbi:hypothetical protein pb186bvf_007622 [Paramecium bursaria]